MKLPETETELLMEIRKEAARLGLKADQWTMTLRSFSQKEQLGLHAEPSRPRRTSRCIHTITYDRRGQTIKSRKILSMQNLLKELRGLNEPDGFFYLLSENSDYRPWTPQSTQKGDA
jgi:hypothetical protein